MVATRRSQGGSQNSPSSANKKSGKRSSELGSSPTAKRGRTKKSSIAVENEVTQKAKDDASPSLQTNVSCTKVEKVGDLVIIAQDKKQTRDHETERVENDNDAIEDEDNDIQTVLECEPTKSTQENSITETAVQNDVGGSVSDEYSDHAAQVMKVGQEAEEKLADCLADLEAKAKEYYAESDALPVVGKFRTSSLPSEILEEGIVYFFFSQRVDGDGLHANNEVEHSYMILRPLPLGAAMRDGLTSYASNARVLKLTKNFLPKSYKDRFFVLVEKARELTDKVKSVITANHSSAGKPVAEGVYAISHNTAEAHLSYHIKFPDIGQIHSDVGIKQKGCFSLLAQNPTNASSRTTFPGKFAIYPSTLLRHFSCLRWMPLIPELLTYDNTQFLMIGEDDTKAATEYEVTDGTKDKEYNPMEDDREFEHEDCMSVAHLKHDCSVFAHLAKSCDEYPKKTTW